MPVPMPMPMTAAVAATMIVSILMRLRRPVRDLVILHGRLAMRVCIGRMGRAMLSREAHILGVPCACDSDGSVTMGFPRRSAVSAEERHRNQPEHVKRCH